MKSRTAVLVEINALIRAVTWSCSALMLSHVKKFFLAGENEHQMIPSFIPFAASEDRMLHDIVFFSPDPKGTLYPAEAEAA